MEEALSFQQKTAYRAKHSIPVGKMYKMVGAVDHGRDTL